MDPQQRNPVVEVLQKFHHAPMGLVPKGLLTFLSSLYKEVAKTTPGTLVYRFERQTVRKVFFFHPRTLYPQLRM